MVEWIRSRQSNKNYYKEALIKSRERIKNKWPEYLEV